MESIGDIDHQEKTCVELTSIVWTLLTQPYVPIRIMIVKNVWRSAIRTLGEAPDERTDLLNYSRTIEYCNSIKDNPLSTTEFAAMQLLIHTTTALEKGDVDEHIKQGIVLAFPALDAYNAAHGRKFVKEPTGCTETTQYVRALRDRFPHMTGKQRYRVAEAEALSGKDSCPFRIVGNKLVSRSTGKEMQLKTFQNK